MLLTKHKRDEPDKLKKITEVICLWCQEHYTDREALELIYDIIVRES